jgi:hypothetical protein
VATLVVVLTTAVWWTGTGTAAADDPMGPPSTTLPVELPGQAPEGADCGPGNIVRFPNCGQEPASRDEPGGWLQVSLFFLICATVIAMVVALWWRSRTVRARRKAAGLDPVDVARSRGEGVRSTR